MAGPPYRMDHRHRRRLSELLGGLATATSFPSVARGHGIPLRGKVLVRLSARGTTALLVAKNLSSGPTGLPERSFLAAQDFGMGAVSQKT